MDEDAIVEYVERSRSVIDSSPQMNEESTREKLVRPLIEVLGWDFYFEVEPEYPVQMGSTRKKVDYALILEETPVVFIEVKGNDTTISESNHNQLRSYMRQVGVDWGLLTNGSVFVILKRQTDSRKPTETTLGEFQLSEMEDQVHLLQTLSKESIKTGESESIAQNIEAIQHTVSQLRNEKDDIAERVSGVINEEVGDVASQRVEKEAKEFIDSLIDSLGAEHEIDSSLPNSTPAATDKVDTETEGYLITISNKGKTKESFVNESQSDVMADAVDWLIQQQGLIDELDDFPYVPGKKKAILNTEPKHPSGEEMRLYREISDGYYVFVSLKQEDKKRYVKRFATLCGLTVSFEGDW